MAGFDLGEGVEEIVSDQPSSTVRLWLGPNCFSERSEAEKGTTVQETKVRARMNTGKRTNRFAFACVGTTSFFANSFKPSAKSWSSPQKPTTSGF